VYHKHSLSQALIDLFPNIGLVKHKFKDRGKNYIYIFNICIYFNFVKDMRPMKSEENRRTFFEVYAKQNGFDPLIAEYWYAQTKKKILSAKVGSSPKIFLLLF
jgi:hypothetical protein